MKNLGIVIKGELNIMYRVCDYKFGDYLMEEGFITNGNLQYSKGVNTFTVDKNGTEKFILLPILDKYFNELPENMYKTILFNKVAYIKDIKYRVIIIKKDYKFDKVKALECTVNLTSNDNLILKRFMACSSEMALIQNDVSRIMKSGNLLYCKNNQ